MVIPYRTLGPDTGPDSEHLSPSSLSDEPLESHPTIRLRSLFYGILFEGFGAIAVILVLRYLRSMGRP